MRGGGGFFDEAVIEGAGEIERGSLELLIEDDEHVGSRFHSRRRNDGGARIDLLVGLESCEIKRSVAEKIILRYGRSDLLSRRLVQPLQRFVERSDPAPARCSDFAR